MRHERVPFLMSIQWYKKCKASSIRVAWVRHHTKNRGRESESPEFKLSALISTVRSGHNDNLSGGRGGFDTCCPLYGGLST